MTYLHAFTTELAASCQSAGVQVRRWTGGSRSSANLIELLTRPKASVLYVKEFGVPDKAGFWGLTRNHIIKLESSGLRWFVVLLLRSGASGYVLTGSQVRHRIDSGLFELSGDGDFKVNENRDLAESQRFSSVEELVGRLL